MQKTAWSLEYILTFSVKEGNNKNVLYLYRPNKLEVIR